MEFWLYLCVYCSWNIIVDGERYSNRTPIWCKSLIKRNIRIAVLHKRCHYVLASQGWWLGWTGWCQGTLPTKLLDRSCFSPLTTLVKKCKTGCGFCSYFSHSLKGWWLWRPLRKLCIVLSIIDYLWDARSKVSWFGNDNMLGWLSLFNKRNWARIKAELDLKL